MNSGAAGDGPAGRPTLAALPRPPVALLFDFDGVIVDSAGLKTAAYGQVYEREAAQKLVEVLAYQRLNGGLSRREKFAYFERQVFGRAGDVDAIERLASEYRGIVFEAVLACPFIAGALEFLRFAKGRLGVHLISGTPHDELVEIVARRDLNGYFDSVRGAPMSKRDAFARILDAHGHRAAETLAIGDALTEHAAAHELGIPFLGIVPEGGANPFPAGVPVLADLRGLAETLSMR